MQTPSMSARGPPMRDFLLRYFHSLSMSSILSNVCGAFDAASNLVLAAVVILMMPSFAPCFTPVGLQSIFRAREIYDMVLQAPHCHTPIILLSRLGPSLSSSLLRYHEQRRQWPLIRSCCSSVAFVFSCKRLPAHHRSQSVPVMVSSTYFVRLHLLLPFQLPTSL